MSWTEPRIEQLKSLSNEGLSASLIAERMETSRNAVLGKMSRLKLRHRMKTSRPRKPAEAKKKQQIIKLNLEQPNLTALQIAKQLGCSLYYVYAISKECGLQLGKPRETTSIAFSLGFHALRLGLSKTDLEQIAIGRQVAA